MEIKKAYHLKISLQQNKKLVEVVTRVYDNIYSATEAINDLNDIFHNTLLICELMILEVTD